MYSVQFLGTAPGCPVADRFHSSFLLEADGRHYLVDAGEPCSQRLKNLDVPFSSHEAVFISHGHSDHIAGLPMFLQGCWLEKREDPLDIYLPGELIIPLHRWLDAVYLPEKILGFPVRYTALEEAEAFEIGDLTLRPKPTYHLEGLGQLIEPGNSSRFKAYSLDFSWKGKRMVYSADLDRPEDLDGHMDGAIDLLICELSHFSPGELFAYLRDKEISGLCLTHLSDEMASRRKELLHEARNKLPTVELVRVVNDGDVVEF